MDLLAINDTNQAPALETNWFLFHDNDNKAIRLCAAKLNKTSSKEEFAIKRLEDSDLLKFDVGQKKLCKMKRISKSRTRLSILCANCDKWFDGFCTKHPLIFIHEKTPKEEVYTVNDTFPSFLRLERSTIPNAGMGVFARVPLPAGLSFGPYSGILENTREAEISGYSWHISKNHQTLGYIDAKQMNFSNWMRYVNCPRFEKEQNMIALLIEGSIFYYTFKSVKAGEELMVWYGKEYGIMLKIPNAEKAKVAVAPKNKDLRKSIKKEKKV